MAKKAIYQKVFEDVRDSGRLDQIKPEILKAKAAYGEDYTFAWAQHLGLWRTLYQIYLHETSLSSIPLPSMKKFRKLVENYVA